MTIIGINGSQRRNGNTATMLTKALEGAASQGADTELLHLHGLLFKGCSTCLTCKLTDGSHTGLCPQQDDLSPIIKKIMDQADALILGTPIYEGAMTTEMRSFIERLLFAPPIYTIPPRYIFSRKIKIGIIYTIDISEEMCDEKSWRMKFKPLEASLGRIFNDKVESFCCYEDCLPPDYSRKVMEPAIKKVRHEHIFQDECRKAFEFGCLIANKSGLM